MLDRLFRQFSGPEGPLGHVAGWLMVRKNQAANAWLVEQLGTGAGDRVVEIGFGPGLGVERHVARGAALVAGVDRSALMVRKARARLARAARDGRVDLREGSVEALPFGDGAFTRAMALNSLQFWPSAEAGLRELHRVLAPGGRLALGQRLRKEGAGRFDRSRFGMTDERLAALVATLGRVGFGAPVVSRRAIGEETIAAIVAARP